MILCAKIVISNLKKNRAANRNFKRSLGVKKVPKKLWGVNYGKQRSLHGIGNVKEFEHRTGNSPCRNSLLFQYSVDAFYAEMQPSLAQVDHIIVNTDSMEAAIEIAKSYHFLEIDGTIEVAEVMNFKKS